MDPKRFHRISTPYHKLPWYRRRWFVMLTLLLCMPATMLIALTGDVYAKKGEAVYRFSDTACLQLALITLLFMAINLLWLGSR